MITRLTSGFLITLFFALPALAQDKVSAIAMNGQPAYSENFDHLPYANPMAPRRGQLRQCAIGTFDTLNDNNIKGKPAEGLHLLNDTLMRRVWSEPFSLYGLIAQTVEIPEDRSSITFNLNPNAQFHDGTKITAADVQFSYETLKAKGKPNTRNIYALVNKISIPNDETIRFDFNEDSGRETPLILAMMPVLSQSYWQDKEFDATTLNQPLGSGPYKIKSVDAGKSITYERVHDYWAKDLPVNVGHYNFDTMIYDYYRDNTVALEAFQSGACDIRREFNPATWQTAYKDNQGYITESLPHDRPEKAQGFIFNTRRPPLNDLNVRKALTMAFQFDWMNRTFFDGKARRIESTFPNSSLIGDFKLPTDDKRTALKNAADLLDEAGYPLKDGKRFNLTILLNNPMEEKIALGYARDLKRLGINLNIRTLDTAQFYGALSSYDYDMVSWRWVNTLSPGTEQAIYWGCAAAKTEGSRNYAGICDEDIDEAIKTLTTAETYDILEARTRLLDNMIMEQYPFIPLYYTGVDYVARWPHIKHPDDQPIYGMVLETWWYDK